MKWKPIDFQGIVTLDSTLVELLRHYLDEQEEKLSRAIVAAIPPTTAEPENPIIPAPMPAQMTLSNALEAFAKKDFRNTHDTQPLVAFSDWKKSVAKINAALWHYMEALESCVTEFFLQLEQISIEQWHVRLAQVVTSIKEMLNHCLEELAWAIKRLENQLWKCRWACEPPHPHWWRWLKLPTWRTSLLDRSLLAHISKNQEFLRQQHLKFQKRYQGYVGLLNEVDKTLERFSNYPVLSTLDRDRQKQFIKLFQLLKLWELNCTEKALPQREFILALRNAISVDGATSLFKEYYEALKSDLFNHSLFIKQSSQELSTNFNSKKQLEEALANGLAETSTLSATISHYREFLLRADPDPYIRTRLGFSEWTAGPEPMQTKILLSLGYDVAALIELFNHLDDSVKKWPDGPKTDMSAIDHEIQEIIYEMGQPLATHRVLRAQGERVLELIEQIDELGSFDISTISYVGRLFSKLLRLDWKYHVLHGIPLFHKLYDIHIGLLPPSKDRSHINRLRSFDRLLKRVQELVKTQKAHTYFHEIELDMNDIKGYLQDLLAYVQRICNDKKLSKEQVLTMYDEISKQLLEYRYLFGSFFYQLRQSESEGALIRRQFLFVDQYFETIELRLFELQESADALSEQDISNEESDEES